MAQGAPEYYEGCFGGKTGVTEASKNTLVSGATRDGMTLIAVAMRADARQVCQDHISMFDYGFNNFQKVEVPGGAVTIPKDVQVSDLTNTDNSYYYGTDYYVGSMLQQFNYKNVDVPQTYLDNSGRELNNYYKEKLINRVVLRVGNKLFVPLPIRAGITIVRSFKYIWEGIRTRKRKDRGSGS